MLVLHGLRCQVEGLLRSRRCTALYDHGTALWRGTGGALEPLVRVDQVLHAPAVQLGVWVPQQPVQLLLNALQRVLLGSLLQPVLLLYCRLQLHEALNLAVRPALHAQLAAAALEHGAAAAQSGSSCLTGQVEVPPHVLHIQLAEGWRRHPTAAADLITRTAFRTVACAGRATCTACRSCTGAGSRSHQYPRLLLLHHHAGGLRGAEGGGPQGLGGSKCAQQRSREGSRDIFNYIHRWQNL
mmetsp:Transcript_1791/g.3965  ORF Transcript_1791/g.3965 Transcript_1791/m.3965 type:complete len:241 (-) Transcript_1791:1283-2005(-)